MKKTLLTIATILLTANLAYAGRVVMSFTDSRGGTGNYPANPAAGSYPQILDVNRTDFTVCNKYKNGRTTVQGLAEFETAYNECAATGEVTDVMILLGINDMLYISGQTSTGVALNVRDIATMAYVHGARVWLLTETPGPIAWGGYSYMNARLWTRDNSNEMRRLNAIDHMFNIIDIRDEFMVTNWYNSTCSSDSLHPTGLACRQLIANILGATLP